jgi:hypothetical protein
LNTPDPEILSRIGQLVDEERTLRRGHRETPLEPSALERLEQIEVQLDQCWDLLNQRRALAEYGLDPDAATLRDESTVEGYEQ